MNKDELKGKLDHLKGRVKEAAESLTGGKEKRASSEEGAAEKIKQAGERVEDTAREKAGQAKRGALAWAETAQPSEPVAGGTGPSQGPAEDRQRTHCAPGPQCPAGAQTASSAHGRGAQ